METGNGCRELCQLVIDLHTGRVTLQAVGLSTGSDRLRKLVSRADSHTLKRIGL